jgi:hypothetical protein
MGSCATISEADYERLKQLYREAVASSPELAEKMSQPFCGVVGAGYATTIGPKIVYIGKATYVDSDGGEFQSLEHLSLGWRGRAFDDFPTALNSDFWRQMDRVVETIYGIADIPLPTKHRQVAAWTNLMKISGNGGNPTGKVAKLQRDASAEILSEEMRRLDPDIVWIVTGDFESDIVYRVFGAARTEWIPPEGTPTTLHRVTPNGRSFVAWTRHPQGQSSDSQRRDTDRLARLAVDSWKKRLNG